jgi:hypothetical protein
MAIIKLDQYERFRFFDLPRELRDRTYHFALQGLNIEYDLAPKPTQKTPNGQKETLPAKAKIVASYRLPERHACAFPKWLITNKQLREEALE